MNQDFEMHYRDYLLALEKMRNREITMIEWLDVLDAIKALDIKQFRARENERLNTIKLT